MKHLNILALLLLWSQLSCAQSLPGDINLVLDQTLAEHSYKFRLVINNTSISFATSCLFSPTELSPAFTYGSIGQSTAILSLQALDCSAEEEQWITLDGYLNYDSNYWYDLNIDMVNNTFHS